MNPIANRKVAIVTCTTGGVDTVCYVPAHDLVADVDAGGAIQAAREAYIAAACGADSCSAVTVEMCRCPEGDQAARDALELARLNDQKASIQTRIDALSP